MRRPLTSRKLPPQIEVRLGALILTVAVVGCGASSTPGLIPISGTVTYQGSPLPEGELRYIPQDSTGGRMARGKIKNGNFSLTTARRDDGVKPGQYKVIVVAYGPEREPDRDANGYVIKAYERPLLVPKKYAKPETTPLNDNVDEKHSGAVQFELTD